MSKIALRRPLDRFDGAATYLHTEYNSSERRRSTPSGQRDRSFSLRDGSVSSRVEGGRRQEPARWVVLACPRNVGGSVIEVRMKEEDEERSVQRIDAPRK